MRLPSQPADSRELLRHVSLTLDGPEEVIMADEYVNEHAKKTRFRLMDKVRGYSSPTCVFMIIMLVKILNIITHRRLLLSVEWGK